MRRRASGDPFLSRPPFARDFVTCDFLPRAPTPAVLRNFSAPVRLTQDLGAAQRRRLIAGDPDAFNRWETAQQFAASLILDMVAAIRDGGEPAIDDGLVAALGDVLRDEALDKAVAAEILSLPGESYLAQRMTVVDVDAIHVAREALRRAFAEACMDELLAAYHGNVSNRPYSPDPAEAARRIRFLRQAQELGFRLRETGALRSPRADPSTVCGWLIKARSPDR